MRGTDSAPSLQVCEFVQMLVRMMRPALVVETGVGQGYMTRAIVDAMGDEQTLVSYESDDDWRAALWGLPFWTDNRFVASISPDQTPDWKVFAEADLCIIDSGFDYRFAEIELWHQSAKPGAVALIHDTGEQHHDQTVHVQIKEWIVRLGHDRVLSPQPAWLFRRG